MSTATRRLPGIRFEAQAPPSPIVLPRMDIAAFVGFASAGPLDVPVPVESAGQFAEIFGPDPLLARDEVRGEDVAGYLGAAVRGFFRNGGRRCWIVRVAGEPRWTTFQLPGIAALVGDELRPARLRARAPGSWADAVRLSTSLSSEPVRVEAPAPGSPPRPELEFRALVSRADEVRPGDLLRARLGGGWSLVFVVASARAPEEHDDLRRTRELVVTAGPAWWIRPARLRRSTHGFVHYVGPRGEDRRVAARVLSSTPDGEEQRTELELDVALAEAPVAGALVLGVLGGRRAWLSIRAVGSPRGRASAKVCATATPYRVERRRPAAAPRFPVDGIVERLALELRAERGDGTSVRLDDLGFAPAHPRFVGALPTDDELYRDAELQGLFEPVELVRDAAHPRFPLAGAERAPDAYLPIAVGLLPSPAVPATRPPGDARIRDGLDDVDAGVFLDASLDATHTSVLLETANFIRYESREPRALRGIHSLLDVEEATLVAVPDAIQRRWSATGRPRGREPAHPAPAVEPDWSRFVDCAAKVPAAVRFEPVETSGGTYSLAWTATDVDGAEYELQEAGDAKFETAATVYRGAARGYDLFGRPRGARLYYRVRALADGWASAWSEGLRIDVTPATGWRLEPASSYDPDQLLHVQRALMRLCAVRGDMLAVLALPEHYRERETLAHPAALAGADGPVPLLANERPALSYAALYHPWPVSVDPEQPGAPRTVSPEGAACGVLARRAYDRGAWVAPANEPLRDVVALEPTIAVESRADLQRAQVNLLRHEPSGFLWLSADTLSEDEEVRPVSVRRLLQLLRRAAILHGVDHVFEPNDDVLARTVERHFDEVLARMFRLGAFAGRTPAESYAVRAGIPPNTEHGRETGLFLVELMVAPSRPLEFLTVRLARTGAGALQVETR